MLFRIILYYIPIWYESQGSRHFPCDPNGPRSCILVTIALYLFVGIEIARRRRSLRSMSSNLNTLGADDTIPHATTITTPSSCGNSTTAEEYENDTHPSSTEDSRKYCYPPSTTTQHLSPSKTTSLSFRQYILMPLFFFFALLLVWVAPSTNRVASFIDPSFASYPLLLIVGITGSLRGFWNGIVFVVVGMRSWKRRKESDEVALRPMTGGGKG